MGEYDRFGFGYAYPDGLFEIEQQGREYLFYYYHEDNDGHNFMRNGSNERIVVKIRSGVDKSTIKEWLIKYDLNMKIKSEIMRAISD